MTCTELFRHEAARVEAGGNRPFLLEGDSVWLVDAGRVDVFAVKVVEGRPAGTRQHLFRVEEGGLLFAADAGAGPERSALLAVGASGTELLRLPQSQLWEAARRPELAAEVGAGVEEWIDALYGSLSPGTLAERLTEVDAGDEVALDEGGRIRPRPRVLWVRHLAGCSHPFGEPGVRVNGDGPIPLSRRGWLEVAAGSRIEAFATPGIVDDPELHSGLERLHRLVLWFAAERMRRTEREQGTRMARRAAETRAAFRAGWASLAEVMEGQRGRRPQLRMRFSPDTDVLLAAARLVGEAQGIEIRQPPSTGSDTTITDPLAGIARASAIRTRRVTLGGEWWREDAGPLLGFMEEDGRPVALLPVRGPGYVLHDPTRCEERSVTREVASTLAPVAYAFYRGFDNEPLDVKAILRFGLRRCHRELAAVAAFGLAAALLGLALPIATGMLYNDVIPGAERRHLVQMVMILVGVSISTSLFTLAGSIALLRVETKMGADLMAAVWDRLLSLPARFFRAYTAGNLASRAMAVERMRQAVSGATINALLTGLWSLVQFVLLYHISPRLALVSGLLVLLTVSVSTGCSYLQLRYQRSIAALQAEISGTTLQLLSNVGKLRVAGAEPHAFALWARKFAAQRSLQFRSRTIGNVLRVFNTAFPLLASLTLFSLAVPLIREEGTLRTGDFIAFLAAFAAVTSGMISASGALMSILNAIPFYEQVKPILETPPEVETGQADPGMLRGEVRVEHLVFRYSPDGPRVLDDVSLHVRPGEFVAIVGPSGSGKSTLIRLLLGFERPESGTLYYDGHDLMGLDVRAVRGQIGVVLQNTQLLPGDIFTNIVGSSPATEEDAWEAAGMAGFDEDIRSMPMGMHTVIGEGASTISGGQRQRLLIARALVRKPRILLFDEATSALDNRTQAIVSASLERLQVTRIVVAHRLSTIMHAHRIVVIEAGRVVETGTYKELMARNGTFAELARRQLA
jgi:NHLM bacteriocin system ABC transporter ATP-binding protein